MELFFNKFLSNLPVVTFGDKNRTKSQRYNAVPQMENDTFVKSTQPVFTGKKGRSTKKGAVLKDLDNITCPYSGVKMITPKKMEKIERDLSRCENITEQMDILDSYRSSMQKLEKNMYSIFKGYEIKHPESSLNDCLQEMYPEALNQLKIEQLKVLDSVDRISNKMDAATSLEVRKITVNARNKIINDDPYVHRRDPKAKTEDHIFKRKDLLNDLKNATYENANEAVFEEMWEEANKLPKSSTSMVAFIVKYADRTPKEIAARLLRPSVASIEHITPANPISDDIKAGECALTNFMLTSRDWNSGRSNTPLPQFIKRHPTIPKYAQKHINDIIKAIKKGKLKECDWYPYALKEKLYNESEGLINLSTEKYHISEEDAFKDAPADVVNTYNELLEKNKAIS